MCEPEPESCKAQFRQARAVLRSIALTTPYSAAGRQDSHASISNVAPEFHL